MTIGRRRRGPANKRRSEITTINRSGLASKPPSEQIRSSSALPRFLLFSSGEVPPLNDLPCRFTLRREDPFEGIVVVDDTGSDALAGFLRETRALLAPVASLGSAPLPLADHRDEGRRWHGLAAALAALSPVVEALRRFPERVANASDAETLLLARAFSRGGRLQPVYEPHARELIVYPAAGALEEPWRVADRLTDEGALRRAFFDRMHVCPECRSSRLSVREECSACGSANVFEEESIHHFRCAHHALERDFRQGDALVCPKCRRGLRHIGIDYDKPGVSSACGDCGHVDAEASVGFVCIDCGRRHPGDRVTSRDWHAYALTSLGERWLFAGEEVLERRRAGDHVRAFRALVDHAAKIQARYGRPARVLRVRFGAAETVRQRQGERMLARARAQVAEIVRGELRTSDFVVESEDGLLALLPETDHRRAAVPRERISARIRSVLTLDLGVEIEAVDLSEAAEPPSP